MIPKYIYERIGLVLIFNDFHFFLNQATVLNRTNAWRYTYSNTRGDRVERRSDTETLVCQHQNGE